VARSIYQGSAAAVCQARELSARRRARGLEKKATGSFLLPLLPPLPLSLILSLPPSLPLSLSLPSPPLSLSLSLSMSSPSPLLSPSPLSIFLFFRLSSSSFVSSPFPLLHCFWVIFHRCSGRQKRRDAAEAALPRIRTPRRARAHTRARV